MIIVKLRYKTLKSDFTLKCDDKDETVLEKAKHLPEQATHVVEKAVDLGHAAGVPLPASRLDSEYLVREVPFHAIRGIAYMLC